MAALKSDRTTPANSNAVLIEVSYPGLRVFVHKNMRGIDPNLDAYEVLNPDTKKLLCFTLPKDHILGPKSKNLFKKIDQLYFTEQQ